MKSRYTAAYLSGPPLNRGRPFGHKFPPIKLGIVSPPVVSFASWTRNRNLGSEASRPPSYKGRTAKFLLKPAINEVSAEPQSNGATPSILGRKLPSKGPLPREPRKLSYVSKKCFHEAFNPQQADRIKHFVVVMPLASRTVYPPDASRDRLS